MKLKSVAEGVWTASCMVRIPGGFRLPTRMTVLRLSPGQLMVISPIKVTPQIENEIRELGRVRYIVAPNCMHHLFFNDFVELFPEAERWGPRDLRHKRTDIILAGVIEEGTSLPWEPEVASAVIKASPPLFEEIIFFHHESQTLIVTDLFYNLHRFNNGIEKFFARLNGVYKKLTMSRIGRRFFSDKKSLRAAAERVTVWKPQTLIMAHGKVLTSEVPSELEKAFTHALR
ncbi:DUF4336 domain-containing protein [Bdellovibrio bacteriovorus]|uniref:DUF4336 domain-containing protein n=1 Tax=Bdellovibrio bacteriovorus TaxID=959 RepID=UPI0035A6C2EB